MNQLKLTGAERFWYVLGCILTLGLPYFRKVQLKVALIEVWNAGYGAGMMAPRPEIKPEIRPETAAEVSP